MNQENKRPITVEDLLRLKRAERPAAEFWVRFDRELRTKQLAALVKREPWWVQLPFGLGWVGRYRLPLGATAILALTFVVAQQYRGIDAPVAPVTAEPAAPVVAASAGVLKIEPMAPAFADAVVLPAYDAREISTPIETEPVAVETSAPASRSQILSLLNDSVATELITASLAAAQAAEPIIARGALGSGGFESRAMPERTTIVDPFQQMRDPTSERRIALVQAVTAHLSSGNLPPRTGSLGTTRSYAEEKMYEEQRGRWEGRPEGASLRF